MAWCRAIRKRLGAYRDGELPDPLRDRVQRHIAKCTAYARALQEIRRLDGLYHNTVAVPPVPPAEWENRWERIRGSIPARVERSVGVRLGGAVSLWKRWVWAPAMAAVVIAIFVAGLVLVPFARQTDGGPNCIVTLVETDIENGSVLYYHCRATDLTVITLIPGRTATGEDHEAKSKT